MAMFNFATLIFVTSGCSQDAIPTAVEGPEQNALVSAVRITPSDALLQPDGTLALGAVVKGARGQTVNGRPVVWSTSDDRIAHVAPDGRIVAGNEGTATVTANVFGVAGKATIDVRGNVVQIIIDDPLNAIVEGDVERLSATFVYSNGATRSAGPLVWSSTDPARLWLDGDGEATARAAGEVEVIAEGRGRRGRGRIDVGSGGVATVEVRASTTTLLSGGTAEVWADIRNAKGKRVSKDVTWTTSNSAVVTVSAAGLVTAAGPGQAAVTASVDGVSGSATFDVGQPSGGGGSGAPSRPGKVTDLAVVQTSENAVELSFTEVDNGSGAPAKYLMRYGLPASFQWSSALDVTKGTCARPIIGSAVGSTKVCSVQGLNPQTEYVFEIAAFTGGEEQTVWGDLSPTVTGRTGAPSVFVDVIPSAFQIDVGDTKQLSATIEDSYGNEIDGSVSWTSSTSGVASVSSSGTVTGNLAGQSVIRATSQQVAGSSDATVMQPSSGGGGSTPPAPPPPPPPPPGSGQFGPGRYEPAGMSSIIDQDACTKNLGGSWTYGQAWQNNVTVVGDNSTPSGCALETLYPAGRGDGFSGAAFLNDWGARPNTLYIRLLFKYDANWQQHNSNTTKIIYYGGGSGNQAAEFYPSYRSGGDLQMRDQSGSGMDVIWRSRSQPIPLGQWHELEIVHIAGSAPGAADGWMRIYVDGSEVTGWASIPMSGGAPSSQPSDAVWQWFDSNEPVTFKGIQWGSYWGGSGDVRQHDDRMWWGGLYVSGKP